jgi:hypothetical protein
VPAPLATAAEELARSLVAHVEAVVAEAIEAELWRLLKG